MKLYKYLAPKKFQEHAQQLRRVNFVIDARQFVTLLQAWQKYRYLASQAQARAVQRH